MNQMRIRTIGIVGVALCLAMLGAFGLSTQNEVSQPDGLPTRAVLQTDGSVVEVTPTLGIQGDAVLDLETSQNAEVASASELDDAMDQATIPDEQVDQADFELIEPLAEEDAITNQIVVEFDEAATDAEIAAYVESIGGTVESQITPLNTVVVNVSEDSYRANSSTASSSVVVNSEANYIVRAADDAPTSDPYYIDQWGLATTGVLDAWVTLPDNAPTMRVAVIDSGICEAHPDLADRIMAGWDFVEDDDAPQDDYDHGCGVAGIIAANIDNGVGIAGIAPHVEIMPLRVLDAVGVGNYADVAEAIIYAVDNGAQIINLSLGGNNSSNVLNNAVQYAVERDVLVIAAAGNTASQAMLYPAAYADVVSVGAVNEMLLAAPFSSTNAAIDLYAPGVGVYSTLANGNYAALNGTSFAAPYVTGIAALEMALGRELNLDRDMVGFGDVVNEIVEEPNDISEATGLGEPSDFWGVVLASGSNPQAVADQLGFEWIEMPQGLPNTYLFRRVGSAESMAMTQSAISALEASPQVVRHHQQFSHEIARRNTPIDPLVPSQWHLYPPANQGANVRAVWDLGYDGSGVQIAIVDDGVQYNHPDLSPNYLGGIFDYDYGANDTNPFPGSGDFHGTSVAGVAAAADDGASCGVGAAYNAQISGIRVFGGDLFDTEVGNAMAHQYGVLDISNNSWGFIYMQMDDNWPFTNQGFENAIRFGRNGLGSIFVFAAGNGGQFANVNRDFMANSRYTIAVGATSNLGRRSSYSTPGDALIVSAPSNEFTSVSPSALGITTTDRTGSLGYGGISGYPDCTDTFGGTSSASPLVAGIVALMLEANPNLTWRDVQHILIETADRIDPNDIDVTSDWSQNGAGYWYSRAYGFGRVNALAAVQMAETWRTVSVDQTVTMSRRSPNRFIPDNSSSITVPGSFVSDSVTVSGYDNILAEHVEVYVTMSHTRASDLEIRLTSPDGTVSRLHSIFTNIDDQNDDFTSLTNKRFMTVRNWGEDINGTWTLSVADSRSGVSGRFSSWQLVIHGAPTPAPENNDIVNAIAFDQKPQLQEAQSLESATLETSEPTPSCVTTHHESVWYQYTATENNENVRFIASSDFDGVLSVWSGSADVNTLSEIGCVDADDPTNDWETLEVVLPNQGDTYYIMIAAANGAAGGNTQLFMDGGTSGIPNQIVVNSTLSADICNGTTCTLLGAVNSASGGETIVFNIPGFDVQTISLSGALQVDETITIDGSTQPGFTMDNYVIEVVDSPTDNFVVSNGATLQYLVINDANDDGVAITGGTDAQLLYNYIGLNASGTTAYANENGVHDQGTNTVVSGNVISGNTVNNILAEGDGLTVVDTYIGTRPDGTSSFASQYGIQVTDQANNTNIGDGSDPVMIVGGSQAGLWFNESDTVTVDTVTITSNRVGVLIDGDGSTEYTNTIQNSTIEANSTYGVHARTNSNGTTFTDNFIINNTTFSDDGVFVEGNKFEFNGNVISGNGANGLNLAGDNNIVAENYIGTNTAGTAANANALNGISVGGSENTLTNNLVSGNTQDGVYITGTNNTLSGNKIGVNAAQAAAIPNGQHGVHVDNDADANNIGTDTDSGSPNVIAGNTESGIHIDRADGVEIYYANVGTTGNPNYTVIPNNVGIFFDVSSQDALVSNSHIGGNTTYGIHLDLSTFNIQIRENVIGTASAAIAVGNGNHGVYLEGGGALVQNVISGNAGDGVHILSSASILSENKIGVDANVLEAVPNGGNGVTVGNGVSQTNSSEDIISGNAGHGIYTMGTFTYIVDAYIGTNADASANIPNQMDGIYMSGGYMIVESSSIAGNVQNGVTITGNYVNGENSIIADSLVADNGQAGIHFDNAHFPDSDIVGYQMQIASDQTVFTSPAIAAPANFPDFSNIIHSNGAHGIWVNNSSNIGIFSNLIDNNGFVDEDGGDGIRIDNSNNIRIRKTVLPFVISQNHNNGITVTGNSTGVDIQGAILEENQFPIDLVDPDDDFFLTPNDVDDVDTGSNGLQNYPVLTSVEYNGGDTQVSGKLNSVAGTQYRIDYYTSAICSYNLGLDDFVASEIVVMNPGETTVTFTHTLPVLAANTALQATVTNLTTKETSELSVCMLAAPTDLAATLQGSAAMNVTWSSIDADLVTTYVQHREQGETEWDVVPVNAPQTSFTLDGLFCGRTYEFRVQEFAIDPMYGGLYSFYTDIVSEATSACVANDDIENGEVIASLPYTHSIDVLASSPRGTDPVPACGADLLRTVWYEYTPSEDGSYIFYTNGSDFDTVLSVWTDILAPVGCDDDDGPGASSFVRLPLTNGVTYYVMVAGDNSTGGTLNLNIDREPDPVTEEPTPEPPPPTNTPTPIGNTIGVFYPNSAMWAFTDSITGDVEMARFRFGSNGWLPVTGDWNGDNKTDIAVFKDGTWIARITDGAGSYNVRFRFGPASATAKPVAGDWDGDGIDGIGIFDNGNWILSNDINSPSVDIRIRFNVNSPDAYPVIGDWFDDARDHVGLYANGVWYQKQENSTQGSVNRFRFGPTTGNWFPVAGDWDGDGDDTIALYSSDSGAWRFRNANDTGPADIGLSFASGGMPVAQLSPEAVMALASPMSEEIVDIEPSTTPEVTPTEPPAEVTEIPAEEEAEVTPEATVEVTPEATETLEPTPTQEAPPAEATPEATAVQSPESEVTEEATGE